MSISRRKPPIHCTPCRVTYNGQRYQIESNGDVRHVPTSNGALMTVQKIRSDLDVIKPEPESLAKLVRREASRLRRNRNARERNQALRSLGMTKTPYGWE